MWAVKSVILFHADQMRFDALGCSPNRFARTPNIDRLAASGAVFTRHIASNPVCMPSRASLMTGLYVGGHGVWMNGVPLNRREYVQYNGAYEHWGIRVVPEPPTLADVFAHCGYDTVGLGKFHLTPTLSPAGHGFPESEALWDEGRWADWHGPYYGFRHVEMTLGHGEGPCRRGHYARWLATEHPEIHGQVAREQSQHHCPVPSLPELYASAVPGELHNSAWLARRACAYLAEGRPKDKPFFMFVGFPDPHHPFTPSCDVVREFEGLAVQEPRDPRGDGVRGSPGLQLNPCSVAGLSAEERRTILRYTHAMVYQIDRAVGAVLDELRRQGLENDTIVVFTSDHGDFLCDHGLLRKGYMGSDALLRVPFVVRAPGAGLPARSDVPMSNADVLPTLCGLAGVAAPEHVQGRDVREVLGPGASQRVFASAFCGRPGMANFTCYDERFRYTGWPGAGYEELFDHAHDPGESRNVAGERAWSSVVSEMRAAIGEHLVRTTHPIVGAVSAW